MSKPKESPKKVIKTDVKSHLSGGHPVCESYFIKKTGYTQVKRKLVKVNLVITIDYFPEYIFSIAEDNYIPITDFFEHQNNLDLDTQLTRMRLMSEALSAASKLVEEKIQTHRLKYDNRVELKIKK